MLFLLVMAATGCARTAPATTPPTIRTMPSAVPFPRGIPEGEGGIILETDQPASVHDPKSGKTVCLYTPCSFVGELGPHELSFVSLSDPSRVSSATINIVTERTVARHTLGRKAKASPGFIGMVALGVVGLGLIVGGAAVKDEQFLDARKTVLYGSGSTLLFAGVLGAIVSAPSATPGITEQFRF